MVAQSAVNRLVAGSSPASTVFGESMKNVVFTLWDKEVPMDSTAMGVCLQDLNAKSEPLESFANRLAKAVCKAVNKGCDGCKHSKCKAPSYKPFLLEALKDLVNQQKADISSEDYVTFFDEVNKRD